MTDQPKDTLLHVRLSGELHDFLAGLAERQQRNMSEVVRRILDAERGRHNARVARAARHLRG